MNFIHHVREKATQLNRRIVFPEATELRVLRAVEYLFREKIVTPVLVGDPGEVDRLSQDAHIDIRDIEIISPESSGLKESFAELYYEMRRHKGLTEQEAVATMADPIFFATMMVKQGMVHGYLAGAVTTTAKTVQAGLRILKTKPNTRTVSSLFFMVLKDQTWGQDGILIMADPAIVVSMTSEIMAEIAIITAENARCIAGIKPKVAMLSYSTKGSGSGESVDMVRKATQLAQQMDPSLEIDGELQADAALVPAIGSMKAPGSPVAGAANVLIFPSIESANISYKLVQRLASAEAVGPILQGLSKPANDLSRGCSVEDIINTAAITSLQE